MHTRIPIGPFIPGKLRPLFGRKKNERIIGKPRMIQRIQQISHLRIHVRDLGQIPRKCFTCQFGVGQVRWHLQLARWIGGCITHDPWHMGLDQSYHQTERLRRVTLHEFTHRRDVVNLCRVSDTIRIKSLHTLERKCLLGQHMNLTRQSDPVTQVPEVVRHAPCTGQAGRVIPRTTIPHRIQT